MDNQELLIRPASTLTRKQRKERTALKKSIAQELKLPAGKALGRFRIPYPPPDTSAAEARALHAAFFEGRLPPGTHVIVRDTPLGPFRASA